jgi:hypothetical protein
MVASPIRRLGPRMLVACDNLVKAAVIVAEP